MKRNKSKQEIKQNFIEDLRGFFKIEERQDILTWAKKNISFRGMDTCRAKFDPLFSPYLIEPLESLDFEGVKKTLVFAGSQQMGKSLMQQLIVAYNSYYGGASMVAVYPTEKDVSMMNETKFLPILLNIPKIKKELMRPKSRNNERYRFQESGSSFWFFSSCVQVKAISARILIADEVDQWDTLFDNISELEKRATSFDESLYCIVCTPYNASGAKSVTWNKFLQGSQGFYFLRCRKCGQLTMRSCDFYNLQFEFDIDEEHGRKNYRPDSARLICPRCKHEHPESEKNWMIENGGYIHRYPERRKIKPSFQAGYLAYKQKSWAEIAEVILSCPKTASEKRQRLLASWKGRPYEPKQITIEDFKDLERHKEQIEYLDPSTIECVFIASDTQGQYTGGKFSPTGVFAYDINDNLHLIDYRLIEHLDLAEDERRELNEFLKQKGEPPVTTLLDMTEKNYLGRQVVFHLIDQQGRRTNEILQLTLKSWKIWLYKGGDNSGHFEDIYISRNNRRLLNVREKAFRAELIHKLYYNEGETNRLFLPHDLPEATLKEIVCVQPLIEGDAPEEWQPKGGAVHDAFDVLKMGLVVLEWLMMHAPQDYFAQCKSRRLRQRFGGEVAPPTPGASAEANEYTFNY